MKQDEFVSIWNSCSGLGEFVEETGYERGTASSRASRLRKKGSDLKRFSRESAKIQSVCDELRFYNGVAFERTGSGRYKAIAHEVPHEFIYKGRTKAKARAALKQKALDSGYESALLYLIAMSKIVDKETSVENMLEEMHAEKFRGRYG